MPAVRRHLLLTISLALLGVAGCVSVPMRDAVPQQFVAEAVPAGFGPIRVWGDAHEDEVLAFLAKDSELAETRWRAQPDHSKPIVSNILALSGGADDGAFGAGLLTGWSAQGSRPQFDLVTGISAGGLLAPLAFLGADYDDELASMFTKYDADQIYEATLFSGIFGGSSLADSSPLKRLIDQFVDQAMLTRVAEERSKGRFLIVGTTNIDAQRPVFWDMGRIAQSQDPGALELFRRVLLASASIPGVFPPVHIKVQAGGKTFEELHVDGGATRQLFLSPGDLSFKHLDSKLKRKVQRRLFIVRNGKLGPEWQATKEATIDLAQRSLATLTKSQGIGDLTRMYVKAERDGIDYNLVALPDDFNAPRKGLFDLAYTKPLYETGHRMGSSGIPWLKRPPGF